MLLIPRHRCRRATANCLPTSSEPAFSGSSHVTLIGVWFRCHRRSSTFYGRINSLLKTSLYRYSLIGCTLSISTSDKSALQCTSCRARQRTQKSIELSLLLGLDGCRNGESGEGQEAGDEALELHGCGGCSYPEIGLGVKLKTSFQNVYAPLILSVVPRRPSVAWKRIRIRLDM